MKHTPHSYRPRLGIWCYRCDLLLYIFGLQRFGLGPGLWAMDRAWTHVEPNIGPFLVHSWLFGYCLFAIGYLLFDYLLFRYDLFDYWLFGYWLLAIWLLAIWLCAIWLLAIWPLGGWALTTRDAETSNSAQAPSGSRRHG